MIVECPECQVKFTVQAVALGTDGRQVKCGMCEHVWHQMPEDAEQEPIPEAVKPLSEETELPVLTEDTNDSDEEKSATRFAIFVFLLLLFGSFGGIVAGQSILIRSFPSSILLYKTLGIYNDEMMRNIRLSNIEVALKNDEQGVFLYVQLDVSNISDHEMKFPKLNVILKGSTGRVVQTWHAEPQDEALKAEETRLVKLGFRNVNEHGHLVMVKLEE